MIWWEKYGIVTILSILYTAYLIEMYRHLTKPLKPLPRQTHKRKMHRLIFFFIIVSTTVLCAYILRQFILPRYAFDLIIVTLQAIFIIPFFGALFTDRLLHAWQKKRLPKSINHLIIICTALIGLGSNLLILFASPESITTITNILETATEIITICFILILGVLGIGYVQSTKK